MRNKLSNPFYVELEKVFGLLHALQMFIERFQEILTVRPYSKEAIIDTYRDIHTYLTGAGLILEVILDRIEKYGPKDNFLYDNINYFYNEIYKIKTAFWDALLIYEKDPTRGINELYKISIESLRVIGNIIEFIARELNF